ncbi:TipAS antibiotic-recognition domain-containing protein [uncultured Enorma sp.]|uniref:TipAS antibiotic-recognition domain-containing protein n=1 Tax=uncultured Enorma sp. TaxID=1714346 RepID=UPI0025CB937C|nr:TipAS antibiotic-recognition domain-containing protein [uncultured Enorma sp.]
MPMKDTIAAIRKEAGLTQEEMARRLYVTRQAISRWEQGTTEPGIDMLKLIARELDVPVTALLDMPEHYCQSCGMMFTGPDQHGHEADGSETEDFCRWCYDGGAYTYETTMDEMIEDCAPRMAEAMGWTVDEAASLLGAVLPTLRRWREVAENEKDYGEETRAAYGDEVVDASNKKYLAMGEAAHLQAEELAVAINEQLRRAMEAGDPAGPEARKLVAMHARWLHMYWPDGTYTPEAHKGLADGYVADERFQAYYEKVAPGAAQFLRDAIRACA